MGFIPTLKTYHHQQAEGSDNLNNSYPTNRQKSGSVVHSLMATDPANKLGLLLSSIRYACFGSSIHTKPYHAAAKINSIRGSTFTMIDPQTGEKVRVRIEENINRSSEVIKVDNPEDNKNCGYIIRKKR